MGNDIVRHHFRATAESTRHPIGLDSTPSNRRVRYLWSLLIPAFVTACAADTSDTAPGPATSFESVTVALDEFVVIGPTELDAGEVTLAVENEGTENHQLSIVAAESYEALPRRENGSVDTEKVDASRVLLATEPLFAGFPAESFTIEIEPGTYVFFCALQSFVGDESHVRLGQRSIVTVA